MSCGGSYDAGCAERDEIGDDLYERCENDDVTGGGDDDGGGLH